MADNKKISEIPTAPQLYGSDRVILAGGAPGTTKITEGATLNDLLAYFSLNGYFAGIAQTDTDPGQPALKKFWFAKAGTYTKFKDANGQAITIADKDANSNPLLFAILTTQGAVSEALPANALLSGYATKADLSQYNNQFYFFSYTSASGSKNNELGQPFIIGAPILENGYIRLVSFYSLNATTLKLQVVTKNTADTGFTATGVESDTVTVVNGLNTDIPFNLPVLKGQYIKIITNSNYGLSFGSGGRGGYYSSDNFATTTYRSDFDACLSFSVYKNATTVTRELYNQNLNANLTEDETLLNKSQYVFNGGALAETQDFDMNAAAILIPVPIGKNGVLNKINTVMQNAAKPTFRLSICELNQDQQYKIVRYIDITSTSMDLKALNIAVTKNQFIFIDLQTYGNPMKTCRSSVLGYGSIYYLKPASYDTGTEVLPFNSNFFTEYSMAMELTIDVLPETAPVNVPTRVTLFEDIFATTRTKWVNGNSSWVFDNANKKVTSGATGKDNYLQLNIPYYDDQREGNYIITLDTAGSVARFVTGFGQEGNTVYDLSSATNLLSIYRYDPNSAGATVVASTPVPLVIGRKYKVIATKRDVLTIITVIDTITGVTYSVQGAYTNAGDGTDVGRQNDNYQLFAQSGTVSLYYLEVNAPYRPDTAMDGDSIWEGVYVNPVSQTSSRIIRGMIQERKPGAVVVLLCRGGQTINGTIANFKNEYRYTRPKKLLIKQGTNQGGTLGQFLHVVRLCIQYGIEPYLNHITCLGSGNHVAINKTIDSTGYFNGMNLDIATALNNDIAQGYDAANMGDMVHPNATLQVKMAARALIDCPKMLS